jgi:hypothetical protein
MYIQWFVKGIAGDHPGSATSAGITWSDALSLVGHSRGLTSNWWRNKPGRQISPTEVDAILTEHNLDRHIHDYDNYGNETPFISLATGSVERNAALAQNFIYSAIDIALDFATDAGNRPGALFYGWVLAALNPAVPLSSVAEPVRDLNVYHRWSPFQLEGEITAKIHIPANQIERVEWWDAGGGNTNLIDTFSNPSFVAPTPLMNVRELF